MNSIQRLHQDFEQILKEAQALQAFLGTKIDIPECSDTSSPENILTVKEIKTKFGEAAAFAARLSSFDGFLKHVGLPIREVIPIFSGFVVPLLRNGIIEKDFEYQIVYLVPEYDLHFRPESGTVILAGGLKMAIPVVLEEPSVKETFIVRKVTIGVKSDGETPYQVLVKIPLTLYSFLGKTVKNQEVIPKSLDSQLVNALMDKYPGAQTTSEIFMNSFLSTGVEFRENELVTDDQARKIFQVVDQVTKLG